MSAETAVAEESFVESVEEQSQQQDQGQQQQQQQQSPDELKTAMAELARVVATGQRPAAAPEKVLTEDERNELWAVWNPTKSDPDFFRKWLRLNTDMDPAEVEKAIKDYQPLFAAMQQGLVKQSVVGSRNLMQIELAKLREEFGPMLEYVSSAKAEKTKEKFFTEYPALQDVDETTGQNKFAQVIDAVARVLADQTFPDEKSYFKALAEGAAAAIKGLVPTFDLGAKPKTKTAVTSPRLPRTSVGGTGGTAAGQTPPAKTSDDDSGSLDWMK